MAITSASIEANGWVLRVTHTAGAGGFASYALDPNGTPALTLTAQSTGFAPSGGMAIAAMPLRTLVATKPLRRPVEATNAGVRSPKTIDEVIDGAGVTVRIALSQHVYQGDTGLTLVALAGWRAGEGGATVAVTNGSTLAAPAPIVRWSDVPYQLRDGGFDLEVVVFSHHPNALAPVAGVRFTVTDGTTVKTYWTTALSSSTRFGDDLRTYRVTVDPTTPPALTKGLLRCDYEVFPWIGPARVSDVAGTRSMTGLTTAGLNHAAQAPFVVAYNRPGDPWLTPRYAYVDPVAGATAAAAARVGTSAASAATTPLASISLAVESLRLHAVANPATGTLVAANGQGAITQSIDGCVIRLVAGVHLGSGTTSVASGVQTLASWVVIEGDPANADPRANCILRTPPVANGGTRMGRVVLRRLSVEAGSISPMTVPWIWLDNAELRGASGAQTGITVPPLASSGGLYLTDARWWRYGLGPTRTGSTQRPVIVRNCAVERSMAGLLVVNNRRLSSAIAGTSGIANEGVSTEPDRALDRIVAGNDLRYINGAGSFISPLLAAANAPAALLFGKTYTLVARTVFANNVCEQYGVSVPMWSSIGENNPTVFTQNIFEGNSFAGDRVNHPYNDLNLATVALNDTEDAVALVNRFANNITMRAPSKHDFYNDDFVRNQRVANADPRNHGYRPQAVSSWASHWGVGYEGNVDLQSASDPDAVSEFFFEFSGLACRHFPTENISPAATPFMLDKSGTNTNRAIYQPLPDGTGGGDYRPVPTGSGAFIVTRGTSANIDRDQAGVVRTVPFATGALQSTAALLGVTNARHATRASPSAAAWTAMVVPASARSATRAGEAALSSIAPVAMNPEDARHALSDTTRPIVLPATVPPPERTLTVTGDFRLSVVTAD